MRSWSGSPQHCRGFTLAELAIVTLILGLMVAGVLGAVTNQINQGRASVTQRQLDEIRESLLGFASANGYLPCPDTDGDGIENAPNRSVATLLACTNVEGFLPWVTLGVHQTDAWGIRFRYRIKDEFARAARSPTVYTTYPTPIAACIPTANFPALLTDTDPFPTTDPNNCTFDIQDTGDIRIDTRGGVTGKTAVTLAGGSATSGIGVPVVIMSFGKNSAGGFDASGNQRLPLPLAGLNADEFVNFTIPAAGTQRVFYSRISKDSDSPCSDTAAAGPLCEFDDIVTWISTPVLISKMIQANKLP